MLVFDNDVMLTSLQAHTQTRLSLSDTRNVQSRHRPLTQVHVAGTSEMLSQKLTRITLKMADLREYEELRRERKQEGNVVDMATQTPSPPPSKPPGRSQVQEHASTPTQATPPQHQ